MKARTARPRSKALLSSRKRNGSPDDPDVALETDASRGFVEHGQVAALLREHVALGDRRHCGERRQIEGAGGDAGIAQSGALIRHLLVDGCEFGQALALHVAQVVVPRGEGGV